MYAQWRCNYVKIEGSGSILDDGVTTLIKGLGPTCYEAAGGGFFVSVFVMNSTVILKVMLWFYNTSHRHVICTNMYTKELR